jgi:hypothetical protein
MRSWFQHPAVRRSAQFLAILALILLVAAFNSRLQELNAKNIEARSVRAEGTAVMQTQQALQTMQAYALSDQAPVDWARGEGHYIKDGDKPVVPVAGRSDPSLMLTPLAPVPTPPPNWTLWLRVFTGP